MLVDGDVQSGVKLPHGICFIETSHLQHNLEIISLLKYIERFNDYQSFYIVIENILCYASQ